MRLFTRGEQAQALQNVWWNVERVKLGLQELGCNWQTFFFGLLDVFEHAEGELALNLF